MAGGFLLFKQPDYLLQEFPQHIQQQSDGSHAEASHDETSQLALLPEACAHLGACLPSFELAAKAIKPAPSAMPAAIKLNLFIL
jgi:hypothetical protein